MIEPARHPEALANGDAACWLARVCPECGGLDDSASTACGRCGAQLPERES